MKREIFLVIMFAMLCGSAQHTATGQLVVQVWPEAYLRAEQIKLRFRVSADGASDVTTQTETISAQVRAWPEERIRVLARVSAAFPVSWAGQVKAVTRGAEKASCTSGNVDGAAVTDLVSNWINSGLLTCSVSFSMSNARSLAPGFYEGTVDLLIQREGRTSTVSSP